MYNRTIDYLITGEDEGNTGAYAKFGNLIASMSDNSDEEINLVTALARALRDKGLVTPFQKAANG